MNRNMIINELNNRGFNAEPHNVIKNGVELEGIKIFSSSNIAPIFYTEELIRSAEEMNISLNDVVSNLIEEYESRKSFDFDVNMVFNKDFIFSHIYIGLQKISNEDIVKRPCDLEGIEKYLYIIYGENHEFSFKVSNQILEKADISEFKAWEQALINSNLETTIDSMAKVICKTMNMEYDESMDYGMPLFVISNKYNFRGASAILNKNLLAEVANTYHTSSIVVIPSSVHEMILAPLADISDLDYFSSMVREVNISTVSPTERLTDRAYVMTI